MRALSVTESNVRAVLKVGGPMTRHQIREKSGYAKETVWRATNSLLKDGFIKQIGEAAYLGAHGICGPLFALTEEQMPVDALNNVIHQWVKAA